MKKTKLGKIGGEEFKEEESLDEESIYSEEFRESLVDDDELTEIEVAFMQGYEEAELEVE